MKVEIGDALALAIHTERTLVDDLIPLNVQTLIHSLSLSLACPTSTAQTSRHLPTQGSNHRLYCHLASTHSRHTHYLVGIHIRTGKGSSSFSTCSSIFVFFSCTRMNEHRLQQVDLTPIPCWVKIPSTADFAVAILM
jgi:hypothetical protein